RLWPIGHGCQIVKIVICENVAHTLTRTLAPQSNRHSLARGPQAQNVRAYCLKYVGVWLRPFGGEIASLTCAHIERIRFWRRKRFQANQCFDAEPLFPLSLAEVEPFDR